MNNAVYSMPYPRFSQVIASILSVSTGPDEPDEDDNELDLPI